jgi:hypothetical protein
VLLATATLTVQVVPGVAIDPPARLKDPTPAFAVTVPPAQLVLALGGVATVIPAGNVSLTAIPLIVPVLVPGLVIVRVTVDVPFSGMVVGLKDFVIVGGAVTVSVAVLEATPVPPFVEVGAPVALL